MDSTIYFLKLFAHVSYVFAPILLFLASFVILLGLIVGRIEKWSRFDAIYWAFITAATIGYGDILPKRKTSRILSILVGLTGIILSGIIVAVAVHSATMTIRQDDQAHAQSDVRQTGSRSDER